ncbi:MAG: LuxR C-terminal-related transcriptional regulator [Pseudomonadota bacterium]
MSGRTLEAQDGAVDVISCTPGATAPPDARQAVGALRRLLDDGDGLPVVIELTLLVSGAGQDPALAALTERIRVAGYRQAVLLAFSANERDAYCVAYAHTPVADTDAFDVAFAAAHRHFEALQRAHPRTPGGLGATYSDRFSSREREILSWCAEGKSNWAIARILDISENTVRFHLKNAFRKLDATSRSAAINAALARGVIRPALRGRKAALVEMYRSFVEGDAGPFRAMLADDVVLIATAPPELFPQGGRYVGPDAVLEHAAKVAGDFDCRRFLPQVMVEDGDDVAVYLDVELVHRSTGNVMAFDCAHFWTFRGDKIVHYVELFNTGEAHRQMVGESAAVTPRRRPTLRS